MGLIKKHHFWLLAVICMISGLVGWSMASKSLSAAYTQKKANIEKAFSGLKSISDTNPFPNGKWKEGIAKLTGDERQQVRKAWDQLYNEQKRMLKWPTVLGDDFLKKIEQIPPEAEIERDYCISYATNIQQEIPNLLAIIKATPEVLTTDAGGNKAPAKKSDDGASRVEWADQVQVQKLLDWKGVAPPSAEVWLAQEDLWVYASVLTIISKINADRYVLPIPRIESLSIGSKAAAALARGMGPGHIQVAEQAASGGRDDGQSAAGAGRVSDAEPAAPAADEGRYVDADGKPLAGGGAAKGEFKRMPVFMKLAIDQREIPKLLVECANSPLPVEIRQLRINSSKGAASSSKSTDKTGNMGTTGGAGEAESHTVPLELAGIIYIYNKPDSTKLGGEQATATAEAPAATPAAGATGG